MKIVVVAHALSGFALVAALLSPSQAWSEVGNPGDLAYALDLSWNAGFRELAGSQTIAFTNNGPQSLTTVWLRLWPNAAKGCRRPRIALSNLIGGSAGEPEVDCTAVPIVLNAPVAPGQSGQIACDFVASVPRGRGRYGVAKGYALLGTAIPMVAVEDSTGLHLEPDAPLGESMYALSAAWSVTLTIPPSMEAATTGKETAVETLPDGSRRLTIAAAAARDFAMAIGPFVVHTIDEGGTLVRYFESARPSVDADTVLSWTRDSLASLTVHAGAYGRDEIDVVGVRSLLGDGMEYPELIFTELVYDTLSHEIAHQWFYGIVGNNQAAEPWLDESFTEFSSRRVWGDNLDCDVDEPFAGMGPQALDASMELFEATAGAGYYDIVYDGGACVLERLRRDWGDALFDSFLQDYVASYRDGVASTLELKAAVRAWAPAPYDVDAFFAFARLTTWPE